MVKSLVLSYLLLVLYTTVHAQSIEVIYASKQFPSPDMLSAIPELADNDIVYYNSLLIDGRSSEYRLDSIIVHQIMSKGGGTLYRRYWFKSYKENKLIEMSTEFSSNHITTESLEEIYDRNAANWQLVDDTKLVAGITCMKARHLRNGSIAWYAKAIPYPEGPTLTCIGLPGLVLEIEGDLRTYKAIQVRYSDRIVEIPDDSKWVSKRKNKNPISARNDLQSNEYIRLDSNLPLGVAVTFGFQ